MKKISDLNTRLTIQKSLTNIDAIGNHSTVWEDFYSCWGSATSPNKVQQTESNQAAQTLETDKLDFTVRYCALTAALNSTEYRIIFNGKIYNISHIDFEGYEKKVVRISGILARRS